MLWFLNSIHFFHTMLLLLKKYIYIYEDCDRRKIHKKVDLFQSVICLFNSFKKMYRKRFYVNWLFFFFFLMTVSFFFCLFILQQVLLYILMLKLFSPWRNQPTISNPQLNFWWKGNTWGSKYFSDFVGWFTSLFNFSFLFCFFQTYQ